MDGLREAINKVNKAIEEAKKLTTKDRKAMNKSTFCGPGKSFPVPDCQHVGTAKAFLNRSNFSKSTKQKIAACINGKEKSLGCGKGKPAKAKGAENLFEIALENSEIFKSTKKLVEDSIACEEPMDLDFTDMDCDDCE
jgi:hypothetical protein